MTTSQGYFVSDLHLFARRSQAHEHLEAIAQFAADAHTFVLGGDIFDFKWTTLKSIDDTVEAAAGWLAELADAAPGCHFHVLLGNHDHHPGFMAELERLDGDVENLFWDPYYLRLGNSLFLHGDAADAVAADAAALAAARNRHGEHRMRGPAAHWFYDLAIKAGLHHPVPLLAYPKRRTAKRLLAYLQDIGHGPDTGVNNVYFGHTHRAISDYQYGGVTFHNGGAPIKGTPFRIVPVDVPERKAA